MREYVRYRGNEVKVGVCESLYYVSFPKFKESFDKNLLWPSGFSIIPSKCMEAGSGFLFRFPFPDEDKLRFGDIGGHAIERGLLVKIEPAGDVHLMGTVGGRRDESFLLNLVQQKFVKGTADGKPIMAAVFRDPQSGVVFRVEDEVVIQKIVGQIVRNHILEEQDRNLKQQYTEVAIRILSGYGVSLEKVIMRHTDMTTKIVRRSRKLDSGLGK